LIRGLSRRRVVMIIECEHCRSKFNLDEKMLKKDGSKVRCSMCKKAFMAFPSPPEVDSSVKSDTPVVDFQETIALDSPLISKDGGVAPQEPSLEKGIEEEILGEDKAEAGLFHGAPEEIKIEPEEEEPLGDETEEKVPGVLAKEAEEAPIEEEVPQGEEAPRKKKGLISRIWPIILVIVLLILAGITALYLTAPTLLPRSITKAISPDERETKDAGVRRLLFKGVSGTFVESQKEGQLFVIKGMVVNSYSKNRRFVLVKGAILNDQGKVVKEKLAYAGNSFKDDQLRKMTLEEINQALKDRSGQGNANENIEAGGTIPFMVVFSDLPDNLSEFTVETVSSSPTS
jgi:predicted Zn finger-like uncharacterized protein